MRVAGTNYSGKPYVIAVKDAVAGEIKDVGRDGVAESAMEKADRCAEAIGELVDILAEKGILTAEDVKRFLGYGEMVV